MKNFRISQNKISTREIFLVMWEETRLRKGIIKHKRKALSMKIILSTRNLKKLEGCTQMIKAPGNSHFAHHKLIIQIKEIKKGRCLSKGISSLDIFNQMIKTPQLLLWLLQLLKFSLVILLVLWILQILYKIWLCSSSCSSSRCQFHHHVLL